MFVILWLKTFTYKRSSYGFWILVHPDSYRMNKTISPDLIF